MSVVRATDDVKSRATDIGMALRIKPSILENIKEIHKHDREIWVISIFGEWLRGNYMENQEPYTLHEDKEHRCPSWWNLVYAIASKAGGDNYAHAERIAKKGIIL